MDLRSLVPDNPEAERAFVDSVMARVASHSVPAVADPLIGLRSVARPLLAAAAMLVAAAVWHGRRHETRAPRLVAESIGVPAVFLDVRTE